MLNSYWTVRKAFAHVVVKLQRIGKYLSSLHWNGRQFVEGALF